MYLCSTKLRSEPKSGVDNEVEMDVACVIC